jgi:tetratricopeptide (TPR) repeat protein
MPEANWQNERCYAMRLLGKAHEELGQSVEAHKWFRLAIAEAPNTREPWCELAMFCYRRNLWVECYSAAKSALEIKDKALVYTMNPDVWGAQPYDLGSISAWHLGLKKEATELLEKAIKLSPDDPRLQSNKQFMTADHKIFDKVENANTIRSA